MAEHESGMKVASVEDKWTQGRPPKHYRPWSRGQDWDIQMCYIPVCIPSKKEDMGGH